jgi:signal transduction histidine kinase
VSVEKPAQLTQLRLAFGALGAAILIAVGVLLGSALSRLEQQRLFRHQVVAERVFDEIEREISSLLQHEAERPSEAYDVTDTSPSRWSRFIVGYYRRDPDFSAIAADKLGSERLQRLQTAVQHARAQLDRAPAAPASPTLATIDGDDDMHDAQRNTPDVLRQLNRSVKVRARRQRMLGEIFSVVPIVQDPALLVVERAGEERREGFVLDERALVATMQSWVLSAQGLDTVASLQLGAPKGPEPRNGYRFEHRLAAPLSSPISLHLSRLDDEDDATRTLFGLAALLCASTVLGLFAIYRMVAVQIRFAERRNNFVAAVTHELKTPLTSIRMYGEMLRDGLVQDEPTRREYYATITAEGERLTRLINNVMEHGKLRRGQRPAHVARGDAALIVREVVELMRPHMESEGFSIELDLAAELPHVKLDADALKQVLFNILDNALKYGRGTNTNESKVSVRCAAAEGGVAIAIRDFGPGVRDQLLSNVFEPFFRGEDELTRTQKGTGLGLALVRDLVALMDGQVRARNAEPGFEVSVLLRA